MPGKKHHDIQCADCPSRGAGVFCELEQAALSDVGDQKIANIFKKGQTLFVEGTPPYGLYCISEGNIKVTKTGANGKDSIVRVAKAGDVLGHRSIFTDQFYSATATAMEDTKVCFIDKKYILKLVEKEPSIASNLIFKLGRDLGLSEDKVASFTHKNVFERLAEVLLLLKGSHGIKTSTGKILIDLNLTRDELASMVGTATETVIRFVSEMKEEGIISQEGKKFIIEDESKLVEFASVNY